MLPSPLQQNLSTPDLVVELVHRLRIVGEHLKKGHNDGYLFPSSDLPDVGRCRSLGVVNVPLEQAIAHPHSHRSIEIAVHNVDTVLRLATQLAQGTLAQGGGDATWFVGWAKYPVIVTNDPVFIVPEGAEALAAAHLLVGASTVEVAVAIDDTMDRTYLPGVTAYVKSLQSQGLSGTADRLPAARTEL